MKFSKFSTLVAALVLAVSTASTLATTQFWSPAGTIGSTGGLWDLATANWDSSFVNGGTQMWTQGNDAALTIGATYVVTVSGLVTVANVTVLGSAGTVTLSQSSTLNTLCFPTGPCTFDTGSRIVSEASGSGFNSVAGTVLTKKGTGTLAIQPAGRFTGKWVIQDGGFFSLGSQGAYFGTSTADDTVTLNNGGIRLSAGVRTISGTGITIGAGGGQLQAGAANLTIDVTAKVSGSGSFTFNSTVASASVVLDNAANAFTGPVTIMGGGICKIGVAGGMPSGRDITVATAGTTFDLNSTSLNVNSIASSAGTIAIGAGSLIIADGGGTAVTSVYTGSGKLIKNGSGTVTFSGSNTGFTGEFVVNNGTVGVGGSQGLGAGAGGSSVTLNGGKLSNNGAGGRAIPATAVVNLAGDFTVDDSLFSSSQPGQILFNGPAMITNGNRTITVNGLANLGLGGVVGQDVAGRSLIKAGTGILALTALNTYSGDTTINAGQVNISGTSTLGNGSGTLHLSGGRLNSTASRTASSAPVGNPVDVTTDSSITTSSTAATVDLNITNDTVTATAGSTLTFSNAAISAAGIFQPRFSGAFVYGGMINIATGVNGTTMLQSYNTTGTTQAFTNVISGTGSYNRNASSAGTGGITIFGAANTYSGGTTVNRGTLIVTNTTGSGTGTGAVTVGSDGTLAGNGSVSGTVTLNGTVSPGLSPGALPTGPENWNGAGHYTWQINRADGTAGADPGWDRLTINGGVNIAATPASKFNIDISTLTAANAAGNMDNFDNTSNYVWIIATTTQGVTNFDASAFRVVTTAFSNSLGAGTFVVGITNSGNDLYLGFGANHAPVLTVPANQTVDPSNTLTVTNTATDPDSPTVFTYSLVSVVPTPTTVVSLNTNSGVITWTPAVADGPADYAVTVRVSDNAPSPLTDTKSFNVHVNAPVVSGPPSITSIAWSAGSATVSWTNAIATRSYRLFYTDDLLVPLTNAVPGDVVASGTTAFKVDSSATTTNRFYRVGLLP